MKVTFDTKAWLTDSSAINPADLHTPDGAATLSFYRNDMTNIGWTFAGNATITVDVVSMGELVDNKITALREQAAGIRAEATAKCTRIEGQIQQLLCIENKSGESA